MSERTRRWFVQRSSLGLTFLLAEYQGFGLLGPFATGAEAQAQAGQPASCRLQHALPYAPFIEKFLPQLVPGRDAFVTEQAAAGIEQVLANLAAGLLAGPEAGARALQPMLADSVLCTGFDHATVRELRSARPIVVQEAEFRPAAPMTAEAAVRGLAEALKHYQALDVAEFAIDAIKPVAESPDLFDTQVTYDLHGSVAGGGREERTGVWPMRWRGSGAVWRVEQWHSGPELRTAVAAGGFADVSGHALQGVASWEAQLAHGVNYFRTVMDGATGIDVYGNNGIAAGDYDGDGHDDLYVCQPAGLPNRLYRNRGDGTFEDVTEKAGVGVLDGTSSALFADLDNTGRQDLIVVRSSGPLLFVNKGDGTFELRPDAFAFTRRPQGTFTAVAAADYDRDGLLDVYFCLYSYYQGLSEYQFPQPYYDARNGPPNFLMRNRGNYAFEDVTERAGLMQNNNRYSFACGWNDFDNNGWPDLYAVNDFGRKNLYRNAGDGTFKDIAAAAGVDNVGAGMSVCWFDYDNDGRDDLYVANMWSAAGKRVTTQPEFLPDATAEARAAYRQHADGNALFHNDGNEGAGVKRFADVTAGSNTQNGRWSWSSSCWDMAHSGAPDLYVTNGFISGPIRDNLSSFFWRQVVARSNGGPGASEYADAWSAINEFIRSDHSWSGYQRNNVFVNVGHGRFAESAGALGLDFLEDSRSYALADLDGDGRLEVALKNRGGPQLRILQNQMEGLGDSLSVLLHGTGRSNRDAVGAVVEVHAAAGVQRQTVAAGTGFLAQHSKRLLFGLGQAAAPVRLVVRWPSGQVQNFADIHPMHAVELHEGEAAAKQTPFRPHVNAAAGRSRAPQEPLPTRFATWLAEPLMAPDFALKDSAGTTRSLAAMRGKPHLLLLVGADCADWQAELRACARLAPAWARAGLGVTAVAMDVEGGALPATITAAAPGIAVVAADEATQGVYDIFYRYLFDRRRELPLPCALLLDGEGRALRVYSGYLPAAEVLGDLHAAPQTPETRMRAALPFAGKYYGHALHHNYFTYGVAYLQYGYTAQAKAAFEEAIAREPDYAPAHYNLGLIDLNAGSFDQAQQSLEEAVRLDPASADAWNNLGVTYGQKNDYTEAQKCFEKALSLAPGHVLANQNMVKLLQFQGKEPEAAALLKNAVEHAPESADLRVGYAMLLFGENDVAGAQTQFEKALALDPNNVQSLNGLGVVLLKSGNAVKARALFERCVAVDADFDRPYLNLALLDVQAGRQAEARVMLQRYLAQHPENDDIRQALAQLGAQ